MKANNASNEMGRFGSLLRRAADKGSMRVGVVHPCDKHALTASVEAADAGQINPIVERATNS